MSSLYSFSPDDKAWIIKTPSTPRHWYNYLWSEQGYCAEVSQFGHGRSYYIDEKANMCRLNADSARYLYLRDDDRQVYWNIGEGPSAVPVENFSCEHHLSYTTIAAEKEGIASSWRLFVPYEGYHEVWTVKIRNQSNQQRKISLFSLVSFEMEGFTYPRYYEMYRCCQTIFLQELNGIYLRSSHPFAPHQRYQAFLASSEKVHAYDGDLLPFLGTLGMVNRADTSQAGLYQRPAIVIQGRDCTNSTTVNFMLGGVLQNKLILAPGEEREIHFLFGLCTSEDEAKKTTATLFAPGMIEKTLADTRRFHEEKYAALRMRTPEEKLNRLMNDWLKKQVDFCLVGKKGCVTTCKLPSPF